jgi:hypothetical protein
MKYLFVIIRIYTMNVEAQLLNDSLSNLEFEFSEDVGSIILVDEKPYYRKIKISERQKLVKAEKLFEFEQG